MVSCRECPARPYTHRTKCYEARLAHGHWRDFLLSCPRTLDDMRAEWWSLKAVLDALGQAITMREAEEHAAQVRRVPCGL